MGETSQDITVKIKPVTGNMFSVAFRIAGTVLELKEEICKTYEASAGQVRLIYKGVRSWITFAMCLYSIQLTVKITIMQAKSSKTLVLWVAMVCILTAVR